MYYYYTTRGLSNNIKHHQYALIIVWLIRESKQ